MDKAALRKEMEQKLDAFKEKDKESREITSKLQAMEKYRNAEAILAYAPMKTEVDISILFGDERLLFPYIEGDEMFFAPPPLKKGAFGFLEPERRIPSHFKNAIILVPARALTMDGLRLGRGGGYYDRFLEKNKAGLFSIGLAFSVQIVDELPVENHDRRLDMVITAWQ